VRCPSCGEANPERAKFCLNCGAVLAAPAVATGETRRVVTIVFADMAGSTAIGERLDPEALRRVQARYFDAMAAVIERHGGTVEKYIGDAVMAVFGIPRLHEDDPVRAVRAASEMQTALDDLNERLRADHDVEVRIRIGVNTGEVVAGDPSAGQRLVTGDTVNVAARLEQAAGAGEVLLGEPTYRLVKDAVEVEEVAPLDLKGKTDPVPAYRLTSVAAEGAGHARNLDSPMVGRDEELDLLRRALQRVTTERTSHLFTLLGPAGVGKSRLVGEFLRGLDTSTTVLAGRCLSYGEGVTYFALLEIVRQAAAIHEDAEPADALTALTDLLRDADDGERIARLTGGVFGWADATTPEDTSWAVRRLFEYLARERPLVVLIDDIHWAEPLLLDTIAYLADWTRDAEVLLVCVARPELLELRPGWAGGAVNATTILLEPLPGDQAAELLANLLGDADLPAAARDRILAAAEGNPLFVEEMVGMLIDDGLLRFEDGAWRPVDDLADLTVPPTIALLLAARLDRLDAEERAVIERGAVEGKVFHIGAVSSLTPESARGQVRPRLLALARKELIRPDRPEFAGEDAFRFRHLLIRDAAYQAMPKEQRADLHEAFARWLVEVSGDRIGEYQEILAFHLEQAYRYRTELGLSDERTRELGREAGRAIVVAAERANLAGRFQAALALERAVGLLDGDERSLATIELGVMQEQAGDHRASLAVLDPFLASDDARRVPGPRIRAQVFAAFARSQLDPSYTIRDLRRTTEQLLTEAEALGDDRARTAAIAGLGSVAFWEGRCGDARRSAEELLAAGVDLSPTERRLTAIRFVSDAYFGSASVDEGFGLVDHAIEVMGDTTPGELVRHTNRAALFAMLDQPDRFDEEIDVVERRLPELGDMPVFIVSRSQVLGQSLVRLGRFEDAEQIYRTSKALLDERGETGLNANITPELGVLLIETGRFDEGRALIDEGRAMASDDDFAGLTVIAWGDALLASAAGDDDAAIGFGDAAVGHMSPTDYLCFTAKSHAIRGQVLLAGGHTDDAAAAFADAIALYERKGDVADIHRLRERFPEVARLSGR
jgi:class 3 adenylate cyclase/tetratricopeptide (TPR) repeat protein